MQAQIRQHVHVGRTHAWEQEGQLAILAEWLPEEVDALAILNLRALRF
jgi:hypothetical protein